MKRKSFTIQFLKYDGSDYGTQSREHKYTPNIEHAEHLANEWSSKNIKSRRWCYEAKIICDSTNVPNRYRTYDPQTKQVVGAAYVPLVVGTSYNGKMAYTDEWIEHTTVSTTVDGVTHSVTL